MRKLISLALCLCLLSGLLPAFAGEAERKEPAAETEWETEAAEGYDFSLILRLHPEAFSGAMRKSAEGYAELLQAIRLQGSFVHARESDNFDLRVSVIPVDSRAKPVSFQIQGAQDIMFIHSPLLEDKIIQLCFQRT
jgi:hypothetical protein